MRANLLTEFIHILSVSSYYVEPDPHNSHVIEHSVMAISDALSLEKNATLRI